MATHSYFSSPLGDGGQEASESGDIRSGDNTSGDNISGDMRSGNCGKSSSSSSSESSLMSSNGSELVDRMPQVERLPKSDF